MEQVSTFLITTLFLFGLYSCNEKPSANSVVSSNKVVKNIESISKESLIHSRVDSIKIGNQNEKLRVLVILCSNGYDYSISGYDLDPIIENHLKNKSEFEIVPFSLKKLMGVAYQGVYDKKYAQPIIDKIDADVFIMSRFTGNNLLENPTEDTFWGYETKILNVKSMNQKVSIRANKLSDFKDIENHIKDNIEKLIEDIENLK